MGTNTASVKLIKLMLNSVILRKGALFLTIDIANFYLDTPMVDPEYLSIKSPTFLRSSSWDMGCWKWRPQRIDLLWNTTWLLWVTLGWNTGQWPLLWMFRKGGLLQSHYNTRPLETQMRTNTVLPHCQWFWHWTRGHQTLQPSPLGPTKEPPSPNQYGRQQDCGFECPMGLPQQASADQHKILSQRLTSQPKLAYAQEASTVAVYCNINCVWPEKPVYTRQRHIGPSVARMPQMHSKNYPVPTLLCKSCW